MVISLICRGRDRMVVGFTHTNKHTTKTKFETKRSNIANLNICIGCHNIKCNQ